MPIEPLPLSAATVERLARITTATPTTVLLNKGPRNVWIRGALPLRAGQPPRC